MDPRKQTISRGDGQRPRHVTINTDESKTVESEVYRSDIRHVLAQYEQMGIDQILSQHDVEFRDVTELTDWSVAMRELRSAEAAFNRLHPKLREIFGNDVAQWLDAAEHPELIDQRYRPALERAGFLKPVESPPAAAAAAQADPVPPDPPPAA